MEGMTDVSLQETRKMLSNPDLISYIATVTRPGVSLFSVLLEHTFYKPGTPDNEKFIMHIIRWEELLWFIITIPVVDKAKAEGVANKSGLRIYDGIPTIFSKNGVSKFPLDLENAFSLENEPGHPIYKGATSLEIMLDIEKQLVEEILEGEK